MLAKVLGLNAACVLTLENPKIRERGLPTIEVETIEAASKAWGRHL
jgi:hypothetical protein